MSATKASDDMAAVANLDEARREAGWAEDEPHPDEVEQQEFSIGTMEGDGKSPASLFKRGHYHQYRVSMLSASVPSPRGGLIDPETERRIMVTCEVEDLDPKPQREGPPGAKKLVGWKWTQKLRPVYIEDGRRFLSQEDVLAILERLGHARDSAEVQALVAEGWRLA